VQEPASWAPKNPPVSLLICQAAAAGHRKNVFSRECSAHEKGDLLAYLIWIKV
jgi:hypothetical protein